MTTLERLARDAWRAWGSDCRYGVCAGCDRFVVVRRRRSKWICLDCFDQE